MQAEGEYAEQNPEEMEEEEEEEQEGEVSQKLCVRPGQHFLGLFLSRRRCVCVRGRDFPQLSEISELCKGVRLFSVPERTMKTNRG